MDSAVLIIDLQRDFLSGPGARLPVTQEGTTAVLRAANAVLGGKALADAIPVLIVNAFPKTAFLMNTLRRHAAIEGSPGAALDPRLVQRDGTAIFTKDRPNAFSNPELNRYLTARGITHLYVLGVMAQACVRATVAAAQRRGYRVTVIADGVASDARWKNRAALAWMRLQGAAVEPLDSFGPSSSGSSVSALERHGA